MQITTNSFDFKNQYGSSNKKNRKLILFLIIICVTFIIYVLKLFSMQILEGTSYKKKSRNISSQLKSIPAQRGEIFDRDAHEPLAINIDSFAVDIRPGEIEPLKRDTVIAKIAEYLSLTQEEINKKLEGYAKATFTPIEIKANVSFGEISNIAENITDLPGISWRSKPIRNYRITQSMSHIIGYVGDITKEELKVLYNKGYSNRSIIGKTGIEKQYDLLLQGKAGAEMRTVDVHGKFILEAPKITPPVSGKNLILTIDNRIQTLAEKALGERVGAAIVLRPHNGEILAMVSYPSFDPNIFTIDKTTEAINALNNDKNEPLLNRAINAEYAPASTFKVIMGTAILAEQAFPPDKTIECRGFVDYGDRVFHCHIGAPGHGPMDLQRGLAQSCNVYFWTVGTEYLGVDIIHSYATEFGFGKSLGIDLPASLKGFMPNARWKERKYHEKWLGGDTMNISIGQGYTRVTPLHVANMMAMVVNKGKIYKPHLLKEIRDPQSKTVIETTQKELLLSSNIEAEIWETMQQNLRYTVTDGSAQFPLRNKVVKIAGKTGTGEVENINDSWHSWFVAYGPFDGAIEDMVVVCVLVEATNTWEWWAPYASNIIFQGIFANQDYDEAVDALGFKYLKKPRRRQE